MTIINRNNTPYAAMQKLINFLIIKLPVKELSDSGF